MISSDCCGLELAGSADNHLLRWLEAEVVVGLLAIYMSIKLGGKLRGKQVLSRVECWQKDVRL